MRREGWNLPVFLLCAPARAVLATPHSREGMQTDRGGEAVLCRGRMKEGLSPHPLMDCSVSGQLKVQDETSLSKAAGHTARDGHSIPTNPVA